MVLRILISRLLTDLFVSCQAFIVSSFVSKTMLSKIAKVQLPCFLGNTLWEGNYGKSVGCEG
jgi:hypothetical protein